MSHDLSGYEEVPDRIVRFFADHPDGSLRCERVEYRDLPMEVKRGNETVVESVPHIIYHALAFRSAEDKHPGMGKASEPLPGLTPYTKGSELMNAETSAWGRALAALGYVGKKIASANEVRGREDGSRRQPDGSPKPSPKQGKMISDLGKQKNLQPIQIEAMAAELVGHPVEIKEGWVAEHLTGGRDGTASALIDRLMKGPYPKAPEAKVPSSDMPTDPDDFKHRDEPNGDDMPWEPQAA